MSGPSRRKHERAVARRYKLADREKHRQAVAAERQTILVYDAVYPKFVFETGTTPAEFVALVREGVEAIDFGDRRLFTDDEAGYWKAVRARGARAANAELASAQTGGRGWWEPGPGNWHRKLGEIVFRRIPRENLLRFAPYHDYLIAPQWNRLLVRFRSLVRLEAPGGPYYHSEHKPTVLMDGKPKVVCFDWHAVERARKRLVPGGWQDYDGLGEVFAYFHECQEFEVVTLHPDQTGFTFYDDCAEGFWSREIAAEVLGEKYMPGQDYSYRVGYCPAFVHGDYLLGKTLIFPGYGNTPEYGAILRAPRSERERLIEAVKGLTINDFVRTNDFSLLKWFHDRGIPQVVSRKTRYQPA